MARDITQLYCERKGLEFWAEPLNALSNFAFLYAAMAAGRLLVRHKIRDLWLWWFVTNITLIGLGSFIFHTGPALPTFLADVIPIAIFIITTFYYVLNKGLGQSARKSILYILLLIIAMLLCRVSSPWDFRIAISFLFIPVVATLGMMSLIFHRRGLITISRQLSTAALIFAFSVIVRALDTPLCALLPNGLHFLWHMLNAIVCYLVFLVCFEIRQNAQPV